MIKYSNTKPKCWWIFKIFFPQLDWDKNVLTFGNTIYSKEKLRPDVEQHELVHVRQQKESKIYGAWMILWYLLIPRFRYKLELEAVRVQLAWAKERIADEIYLELREEQIYHLTQIIGQGKIYRSQVVIDLDANN